MLSVVKLLLKGEAGVCALNSYGNYIVDHGKSWKKSWNCVFEFPVEFPVKTLVKLISSQVKKVQNEIKTEAADD